MPINQVSSVMQQATPGHTKTYIKLQCDGKRRCFFALFQDQWTADGLFIHRSIPYQPRYSEITLDVIRR